MEKELLSIDLAIYKYSVVFGVIIVGDGGTRSMYSVLVSDIISRIVAKQQPYNIQMENSFSCFFVAAKRYV